MYEISKLYYVSLNECFQCNFYYQEGSLKCEKHLERKNDVGSNKLYVKCPYAKTKNFKTLKIKLLREDVNIPTYAHPFGDSGFDIESADNYIVNPKDTILIKTGLAFEIPIGYEVQIRPKSGNSLKTKIRISNSPGTIDSNYRGEIGIILDNIGYEPIIIKKGQAIAQGVMVKVEHALIERVDEINDTERGSNGYNSTGRGLKTVN